MLLPKGMEPGFTQDSTEQQPTNFEIKAIPKIRLENIDQGKEHHLTFECCIPGVCPEPRSFRGVFFVSVYLYYNTCARLSARLPFLRRDFVHVPCSL
jgi:hypothetical protein